MEDKRIANVAPPSPSEPDIVDFGFILLAAAASVGTMPVMAVLAVIFGGVQYIGRRAGGVGEMLADMMESDLARQNRLSLGTHVARVLLPAHAIVINGQVVRAHSTPIDEDGDRDSGVLSLFKSAAGQRGSQPVTTDPAAPAVRPAGSIMLEAAEDDDISQDGDYDDGEFAEAAPFVPTAKIERGTIYICIGANHRGSPVYVPIKHGIVSVATGGGKTNTLDIIVGQTRAAKVLVWYGSPKYVPVDHESDPPLDRSPIYDGIPADCVAMSKDDIAPWLARAAAEVAGRYKRMQSDKTYRPEPMVVVLDELKAYLKLIAKTKDGDGKTPLTDAVNTSIQTILTLGRECRVFLVFTSQDGYCGSIEMTKGEIGNLGFRLVHPSLDANSKKNLMPDEWSAPAPRTDYQWYCVVGKVVETIAVPRVSIDMMRAWGLMEDDKAARARRRREILRQHHLEAVKNYGDADLLASLLDGVVSETSRNLRQEQAEPPEPPELVLAKQPAGGHFSARELVPRVEPDADIFPSHYTEDEMLAIIRYASVQHGQSRTRIACRIRIAKAAAFELVNAALGPDHGGAMADAA